MKKKLRIALMFGGTSKEREVSLNTGRTVAKFLDKKKYEIIPIEISQSGKWLISSPTIAEISKTFSSRRNKLRTSSTEIEPGMVGKIDLALLAIHGPGGEDGTIQGMLELMKIPYTCSGVFASSIAMDKTRTKMLVSSIGVPAPKTLALMKRSEFRKNKSKILKQLSPPVVIKPNRLGSSIGVTVARRSNEILSGILKAFQEDSEIVVEEFISGREITVGVLGNESVKVLPVIEIVPRKKSNFYDYGAKYEEGGSEHIIPAKITVAQKKVVTAYASMVHRLLGCRGVTRSDFIMTNKGDFYFLEINTIPGMTPTSLVPQAAKVAGISFAKLLDKLIKLGLNNHV